MLRWTRGPDFGPCVLPGLPWFFLAGRLRLRGHGWASRRVVEACRCRRGRSSSGSACAKGIRGVDAWVAQGVEVKAEGPILAAASGRGSVRG